MYQIGDRVVYGIHGVCRVAALEERMADHKKRTYLVLEPVTQNGSRFLVPTHNETAMGKLRPLMDAKELISLFQTVKYEDTHWIGEENRRKQYYRELLGGTDRKAQLTMISSIYRHREAQLAIGKKIHQCDENFLRDAERLLAGEIGVILEVEYPQALVYLRDNLK